MKKQIIKLTEDDLHQIIENSVRRIITENEEDEGLWGTLKGGYNGVRKVFNGERNRNNTIGNSQSNPNFKNRIKGGFNYIKQSAQNGNNEEEIEKFMNEIQAFIKRGILGAKGNAYAQQLLNALYSTQMGGRGRLSRQYNKQYGR